MVKKLINILAILVFSITSVYGHSMEVIFETPVLVFNKSFGKDWSFSYILNDMQYSLYSKVRTTIPQSIFSLQVIAREEDSIPDIGKSTIIIDPNELLRCKNKTYETIVKVVENGGRYKGNEAQWFVRFSISIED